ncbi:MAG: hypothetical protein A4E39_01653 [Methanoregulaceae archaeon PtaB.Bin152]|nr:MAG: hypothetical protein A4E39_01653 [Methanoregulaceae archaeon PtaB.Bin152]
MKFDNFGVVWLIAMFLSTTATIPVWADVPVNATLETTAISSMTGLDCMGTVTHTNSLTWEQSGSSLHDPPLNPGGFFNVWYDRFGNPVYGWTADPALAELLEEPIFPGEVRYIAGYVSTTLAAQGTTHLHRIVDLDTGNKVGNEENIDITTHLAFLAENPFGRVTSDEDLLIDAAGTHTTAESSTLCPFAVDESLFIPPFCSVVQMGSSIDLSHGSIATSAGARFVSESSAFPVSIDYSIAGGGNSYQDTRAHATGSMNAYVRGHLQEGRMAEITPFNPDAPPDTPRGFVPLKSADVTYSESTSASGGIALFAKEMHFLSGTRDDTGDS